MAAGRSDSGCVRKVPMIGFAAEVKGKGQEDGDDNAKVCNLTKLNEHQYHFAEVSTEGQTGLVALGITGSVLGK